MPKYSISYDEVREYVERLPEGAVVGECANASRCIIANALRDKYPHIRSAFAYPTFSEDINLSVYSASDRRYKATTEDAARLKKLANDFDELRWGSLRKEQTKEDALPLFER